MTEHYTRQQGQYLLSTDPALLDVAMIHRYLSEESYWAKNIPMETVQRSITHSLCFGVYELSRQIGFARIISDQATFAYLADVFILPEWRGKSLSKWMMSGIVEHPHLQGLRNWLLLTNDAHGLYSQFGFEVHPQPERVMRRFNPDVYRQNSDS
jgi:N-acetylglutamate synthase-like GNAT family acetyltransferase